ncbi:uncharacterized protein N7473_011410 [Penicillium subrubescens]|uniref:Uncharacterized protein n=1 Tax=Penicillium subrubescens TaxID=1316194 RepID=A0A1Q5UH45_9EURO|nr:uncharacterized protein N7473_011410 [Penicillium subrubescens]KAJ5880357.1 hypothetical protein N7473_011410 [Penicillium subrubescens]OKP11774.1 hypothetical protein PENSUB_2640 [Penicillium subrubescens]
MSQPCTEYGTPFGAYVALSDELDFLVDCAGVPQKQKRILWPVDSVNNGDIRQNRVPAGNLPILWIHGLPQCPVTQGYITCAQDQHTSQRSENGFAPTTTLQF